MIEIVLALAITIALVNIFGNMGKMEREQREYQNRLRDLESWVRFGFWRIEGEAKGANDKAEYLETELARLYVEIGRLQRRDEK